MRKLLTSFLALIAFTVPSSAESEFRGLVFSDTKQAFTEKMQTSEYQVKWDKPVHPLSTWEDLALLRQNDRTCARIKFDKQGKMMSMELLTCFFGGEDMTYADVVRQFSDRFGGRPQLKPYPNYQNAFCNTASPFMYVGTTDEGEKYAIYEECEIAIEIVPSSGSRSTW